MDVRDGERFTKQMRLRKRSEYLRVQQDGHKVHSKAFVGLAVFGVTMTRIGVTTTKRIGCAVKRNHVRRLVKEAFRRHWAEMPRNAEIVIIAKKQVAGLDNAAVVNDLELLGKRLTQLSDSVASCNGLLSR
jgi:ribonuclease P protein component